MSEQTKSNDSAAELRAIYLQQLQEANNAVRALEAQLEQTKVRRLQLQGAVAGLDELAAVIAKTKADAAKAAEEAPKAETKAAEAAPQAEEAKDGAAST